MQLQVKISADELSKIIAQAMSARLKKPVDPKDVVWIITPKEDMRGDCYGHEVSLSITLPV